MHNNNNSLRILPGHFEFGDLDVDGVACCLLFIYSTISEPASTETSNELSFLKRFKKKVCKYFVGSKAQSRLFYCCRQ